MIDHNACRPAAVGDGWRPIETAPKDWVGIILWDDVAKEEAVIGRWMEWHDNLDDRDKEGWREDGSLDHLQPTHWMPLPSAPRRAPASGHEEWVDPDDAPPLTREWFEKAELRKGDKVIRQARPAASDLIAELRMLRLREVQAIGAAISNQNIQAVEQAYNRLRDKMDVVLANLEASA